MIKVKNKNGFTLIEVLVAMSIILLIAMAFFRITNVNINVNTKNEKDIKSLNIAQSEVENLREQIKEGKTELYALDGSTIINIDNPSNIDEISIEDDKILDDSDNTYERLIENDKTPYKVKIKVTKKENKLYEIYVKSYSKNPDMSKKEVELITQVYGK